jgi:hypothetical protein
MRCELDKKYKFLNKISDCLPRRNWAYINASTAMLFMKQSKNTHILNSAIININD